MSEKPPIKFGPSFEDLAQLTEGIIRMSECILDRNVALKRKNRALRNALYAKKARK